MAQPYKHTDLPRPDWSAPEEVKRYMAAYYQKHKALIMARAKVNYHTNAEERRRYDRQRSARIRAECLQAYGGTCTCCGESRPEFLAIDHTNGDGAAHRREMGKRWKGRRAYEWLKTHGYPKDRFRLLCHNCNLARGFYGYCPHEREKEQAA